MFFRIKVGCRGPLIGSPTLISYQKAEILEAMYRQRRTNDTRKTSAQKPAQESEVAATLPQRIEESAAGLLKGSFGPPPPRAVIGAIASLSPDNTKAGASSSSTITGESSLAFNPSAQCEQATLHHSESFRLREKGGETEIHGQIAFDEFLAGSNELEHEPDSVQDHPASSSDQRGGITAEIAEDALPQAQERGAWKVQDEDQEFTVHNNDGAAVVALLSDLGFAVDDEPSSTLHVESDGAEGQSYKRVHNGKEPVQSVKHSCPWNRSDLIPDFGALSNLGHAFLATRQGMYEEERFLESRVGQVHPWMDILDRYHDEVWGDMLPMVHEARDELELRKEKQICLEDGPAVRRLKMVLQHFDDPRSR